ASFADPDALDLRTSVLRPYRASREPVRSALPDRSQHAVDARAKVDQQALQGLLPLAGLGVGLEFLMGEVERREDGDALQRGALVARLHLPQPLVEQARRAQQALALVLGAGDQVALVEQTNFYRLAHAFCSRDFRRWIIASTRERACSFLAISAARSPTHCSWATRSWRFSSARRCTASTSCSIRWRSCSEGAGSDSMRRR